MSTSLRVLGGSGFVGRPVVREGVRRGWEVATFNRGRGDSIHPGVSRIIGDRLDAATLAPLRNRDWDLVGDTWSGAPRAARDSAAVLADHAIHYVYISSGSVYAPPLPLGVEESAPTVEASRDAEGGDYPALKRGAELAVMQAFGDRALLARAGMHAANVERAHAAGLHCRPVEQTVQDTWIGFRRSTDPHRYAPISSRPD